MLIETQYFPCILFWAQAMQSGKFTIEAHENYQKRSYRNKCRILGANKVLELSIPLDKGKHQQMPIREVNMSNKEAWRAQHLQSIRSAYGSAPYFEFYWDDIEALLLNESENLYLFNLQILEYFAKLLQVEIHESEQYEREPQHKDFRHKILPNIQLNNWPSYPQVFADRHAFQANLSILDSLFCLGPSMRIYLLELSKKGLLQ